MQWHRQEFSHPGLSFVQKYGLARTNLSSVTRCLVEQFLNVERSQNYDPYRRNRNRRRPTCGHAEIHHPDAQAGEELVSQALNNRADTFGATEDANVCIT